MKNVCWICVVILLSGIVEAQDCHQAAWVKSYGGIPYNGISDVKRRVDGKFVASGFFGNATMTLDTFSLLPVNTYNVYLAVHDSGGFFSDAKVIASYGGTDQFNLRSLHVASDSMVYIVGSYQGNSVKIGGNTLDAVSRNRVFFAKYTSNLQLVWYKLSDRTIGADAWGYDITTDKDNNIYVTGGFEDDVFKIDGYYIVNNGNASSWKDDAYLMKFSPNGVLQYLNKIGGLGDEVARFLVADSTGNNIYVVGNTNASAGNFNFDPQHAVPGGKNAYNVFIGKYRGNDGKCIWGKMASALNTNNQFYPYDACLGENNSLFLCGGIAGSVSFPPKTYNSNDENAFLAKVDSNGNSLWMEVIGGQNSSEYAVSLSYFNGYVAVAGRLFSNQPYAGTFPVYSTLTGGGYDAFNAHYLTSGKLLWARLNNSSNSSDYSNSRVIIDNNGYQMMWGAFKATQTWYPVTLTNSGANMKMFLAKFIPFSPPPAFTVSAGPDKITTCGSSVQLSGTTTPSTLPFGWSPDLGFTGNGTKTPTVNPGINTTYILYAASQGCVASDTVNVTYSNNALTVNAGTDKKYCGSDSVQIMTTSNQSGVTYSWVPSYFINTAASQNPWVKPPVSTVYTVTATYNNCKAVDTVAITVNNKPHIYLPDKYNGYSGDMIHLCKGASMNVDLGDPSNTYSVTPAYLVSNVNNNLITLLADTTGEIRVTALSPEGCSSLDTAFIIIDNNQAAPVFLNVPESRTACPGDSVRFFTYITNSANYNFQYGWYSGWQVDSMNGKGWQDLTRYENNYEVYSYSVGSPGSSYYSRLTIRTVNPDMNGFKFRCYSKDTCSPRGYSKEAVLQVGPKMTAQPVNKSFCEGVTDSINVNSSTPGVVYQWEIRNDSAFVPLIDQPGVLVTNGRFLKIINANPALDSTWVRCRLDGCTTQSYVYSDSVLIRISVPPVVLAQSDNDTVCANTNDTLWVVVNNSGPYLFNWFEGNSWINYNTAQITGYNNDSLFFTPVYTAQDSKEYKCIIINTLCKDTIFSSPVTFTVYPEPASAWPGGNMNVCLWGGIVNLSGGTPAGGIYYGKGVTGDQFDPVTAGTGTHLITYLYTDSITGCKDTALKNFVVSVCTGLNEAGSGVLEVFAEQNELYFTHKNIFKQDFEGTVYDINGKQLNVFSFSGNLYRMVLPISNITPGIYLIQFRDSWKSETFRILITE